MRDIIRDFLRGSDGAEVIVDGRIVRQIEVTDIEGGRYMLYEDGRFYGVTNEIELAMDFMEYGRIA